MKRWQVIARLWRELDPGISTSCEGYAESVQGWMLDMDRLWIEEDTDRAFGYPEPSTVEP